jgi:hypothetical protein
MSKIDESLTAFRTLDRGFKGLSVFAKAGFEVFVFGVDGSPLSENCESE